MKAFIICENLKNAIAYNEITNGFVHSVFAQACNIETDNALVTLLSRGKEMAPMSVIVGDEDKIDFLKIGISTGFKFHFNADYIHCSEKNIRIDLDGAGSWFPGMEADYAAGEWEDLVENMKTLEAGISIYSKHNVISPLVSLLKKELPDLGISAFQTQAQDKSIEFISYRFLGFIRSLLKRDIKGAVEKAGAIIGFGPGLTPSMDDFICGIMVAFVYMADYYKLDISKVFEFNRSLLDGNLSKTTRISAEMLKHSAAGETNQAAKELIRAVLKRHDGENITKALIRTAGLGETSGSDLALGLYVGCKIMIANTKNRGDCFNEALC